MSMKVSSGGEMRGALWMDMLSAQPKEPQCSELTGGIQTGSGKTGIKWVFSREPTVGTSSCLGVRFANSSVILKNLGARLSCLQRENTALGYSSGDPGARAIVASVSLQGLASHEDGIS